MSKSLLLRQEAAGIESTVQKRVLRKLSAQIDQAIECVNTLEKEPGAKKQALARTAIDLLESMLDDREWPLPKYRELLTVS